MKRYIVCSPSFHPADKHLPVVASRPHQCRVQLYRKSLAYICVDRRVYVKKKAGRSLSRPFFILELLLLEHAHDFVDDSIKNQIIAVILFKRTECLGMRIEAGKITGQIRIDQISPVAATASP